MVRDINPWTALLEEKLNCHFGPRLLFMGLQGSYRRGEAGPQSDIDIVVILDRLSLSDLKDYKSIIQSMPHGEKACGFIAGKDTLARWPKADLFQFINDTKALSGTLEGLAPPLTREDIKEGLSLSCANLYHAVTHGYLYDNNFDSAPLKKPLFFLFQGLKYLETGRYAASKRELLPMLSPDEEKLFSNNGEDNVFMETLLSFLSKKMSDLA